jgi:16S rRNA (guanine966-N2)-methyltransferase
MGERIRSSLFNILGDVEGMSVLDAFAGSGALGLEAISRGAAHATFVEKDRIAQKVIQANIKSLGVAKNTSLVNASISNWTETADKQLFDLIFVDPPYHDMQLSTVSKLVGYLQPKGLMILSHPGRELAPTVNGVVVVDKRSYGDAALAFYHLDTA